MRLVELFAGQLLLLRVVGILKGKRRQRRRTARHVSFVKGNQFFEQHADGPAINYYMVCEEQQDMLLRSETQQGCTQHWASPEVEWTLRFLMSYSVKLRFAFRLGKRTEINQGQSHSRLRADHLHRA